MEDYEGYMDEAEDEQDTMRDLQDSQADSYEGTWPTAKHREDLYTWFWKVVNLERPSRVVKTGNLFQTEVGEHVISVRDALNIGYLGHTFHHPKFGNYFNKRAQIIATTSMARKGWFMDLSISQRKVRERARPDSAQPQQKWRLFQKKPIPQV